MPGCGGSPSRASRTASPEAAAQPVRHPGGELLIDVLHDHDRRREIRRQRRAVLPARRARRPRRRSRSTADAVPMRAPVAARGGRRRVPLADQPADIGDLAQQRRGCVLGGCQRPARACRPRRARHAPSPRRPGAHSARGRTVTIRIAQGVAAMIRRVASTPSMHRHDQVHQDQVGRLLGAALHRLGAVAAPPSDLVRRLEASARRSASTAMGMSLTMAILIACASPIRSTTALQQRLVVEAALGQVVVGAGLEAAPAVLLAVLVRHDHHRQRLAGGCRS